MTQRALGVAATILAVDAVLLIWVGAAMWNGALSAAEEAVGKGLVAVGAALAVAALGPTIGWGELRTAAKLAAERAPEPVRNDWEDA
jgi:hypothetical protein